MKELEKLKVGDYVRTTKKGIFKIISIETTPYRYKVGRSDNENIAVFTIGKGGHSEIKNDIVDFSPNILDLLKVGDYVNGMEIDEFDDVEGNLYLGFPIYDDGLMDCISEFRPLSTVEIKSILTKEQFENMEYRLEK